MAEQNESEYIEGFNSVGKDLQRIDKQHILLDLLKTTNKARNEVDNTLAAEMDKHQKLQNKLNLVNDDFLKKTSELDLIKKKKQVSLDQTRKSELSEVMRGTLDNYLERRPTDANDKRSVHVYFLTGEEIGSDLHVGREGAGSRDATFIVTLSQSVQSLATQAAKYWGLDPDKVFFLDRDGRIVQGKFRLSDIILPPLTPEQMEASAASAPADTQALVPAGSSGSSSAVAIPKAADDGQIAFTVKGRDYKLTLVRAKTVLSKEDLSQPKGEAWSDFTFDQKRLNEDLEETRKKRGDPDPVDLKISMETIPSLYDLIKQGNLRKFQKNADKWCRVAELLIFLIAWGFFIALLEPHSDWILYMKYSALGIQRPMTQFTLAEQQITGVKDFDGITTAAQFEAWMQGPLRRSVFPHGIEKMNAYVLKVQGRVYAQDPIRDNGYNLNWCDNSSSSNDNVTNSSNTTLVDADEATCYPESLKSCPTKGVVELMAHAIDNGQTIPECSPIYDHDRVVDATRSLYSADAFAFISGQVSSYLGGIAHNFNHTTQANWDASVADFLPSYAGFDHLQPPAKLINVLTFVPPLSGVVLSQFLTEFTPSGPVETTQRYTLVDMNGGEPWQVAFYQVCIVLSLIVLFLEIRRITGLSLPFIKFFEEQKESFGCATILFVMVPVFLCLSFFIFLRQIPGDQQSVLDLSNDMPADDEPANLFPDFFAKSSAYEWTVSEKLMRDLQLRIWLEKVSTVVHLIIFTLCMLLSFRYALVYFPEMRYTTMMIQRVTMPVLVTLLMSIFAFAGFAVMLFLIFSDEQYAFRNWLTCIMSLISFAHGGILKWEKMYRQYAWTWYFLVLASFFVFTLNLNNILIAVLVSHKKEAELRKNYSSHPFWQALSREHVQSRGGSKEVNPALAGYDFGNPLYKEPKKVTEEPGWKI